MNAVPEASAAVSEDLSGVGSAVSAADDEVSAAIAALFSGHAQEFQTLSAETAVFHEQFAQALNMAAGM